MSWFTEAPDGFRLSIWVQPRSSKNMIAGLHGNALKIKLTAPPVDNAANKMMVRFLSRQLSVSKSALSIISGHTSRLKQILVRKDGREEEIREKIEALSG